MIGVWWNPHRETITDLRPYNGPLAYLWQGYEGKPQLAKFAVLQTGMTIEPQMYYEVFNR